MSTILVGHHLLHEGAAHDDDGHRYSYGGYSGTSGTGRGKCSCGVLSPILQSGYQRRAWHRGHKEDIRAGREENAASHPVLDSIEAKTGAEFEREAHDVVPRLVAASRYALTLHPRGSGPYQRLVRILDGTDKP